MRTTFLCLAVLFLVPRVDAAPAPAPGRAAKEKLEALKKRLPAVVGDWLKEKGNRNWFPADWTCNPELRVLRRVGSERAKAVVLFKILDQNGRQGRDDVLLTIFLTYQDGCWTTEQFEDVSRDSRLPKLRPTFAFLMLAIDEAAEKQGTK
jgi:hypothetical protein